MPSARDRGRRDEIIFCLACDSPNTPYRYILPHASSDYGILMASFSLSLRSNKRLNSIDPVSGMEIFQDQQDMDLAHLQLLDPQRKDATDTVSQQLMDKKVCPCQNRSPCSTIEYRYGYHDLYLDVMKGPEFTGSDEGRTREESPRGLREVPHCKGGYR